MPRSNLLGGGQEGRHSVPGRNAERPFEFYRTRRASQNQRKALSRSPSAAWISAIIENGEGWRFMRSSATRIASAVRPDAARTAPSRIHFPCGGVCCWRWE